MLPGDIVTPKLVSAATSGLAKLGAEIQSATSKRSPDFVAPATTFPLATLSPDVVAAGTARAADLVVWADDTLCRQRATVGAMELQRAATGSITAAPGADAFAAGVVVGTSPQIQKWKWDFHAATAYKVEGERAIQVWDPVLFERPVPISRWAKAIGTTVDQLSIETPITAHRGTLGGDMAPTELLTGTWDRMPNGYRLPGELRLDPEGTDTVVQRWKQLRDDAA